MGKVAEPSQPQLLSTMSAIRILAPQLRHLAPHLRAHRASQIVRITPKPTPSRSASWLQEDLNSYTFKSPLPGVGASQVKVSIIEGHTLQLSTHDTKGDLTHRK